MDSITSLNIEKKPFNDNTCPETEAYLAKANHLVSLTLNQRQCYDLELILNGGFAPLTGFMNQNDYLRVLKELRLADGTLWPMPITLDVETAFADSLHEGDEVALRDREGLLLAILCVKDSWLVNKPEEAQAVFGTTDATHPGVAYLYHHVKSAYIGGALIPISLPHHYDFNHLRFTPTQLRQVFAERGWQNIVAFQTRNPMHKAHQELTLRAMEETNAHLLIHPVVGLTKPGDIDYYIRVRCYEHVLKTYPPQSAFLSLLPLAMRMAGPREALWHALIRKNYGCTHFIVGRDHAGPGKDRQNQPFYEPYAAHALTQQYQNEMGIRIVFFQEVVYSQKEARYFPINAFPKDETPDTLSGTELRKRLQQHEEIPDWFSYPAVIKELRKAYPARHEQGFTLFLTGLPSSGKSTLANALLLKLRELSDKQITLLDGDVIRTHLSQGLGFSQADRETNVLRVGFVAKEITKHGGIAICALIAPYQQTRQQVRDMISEAGGFIEIHVATPLSICEIRDRKGLYKKARQGLITQFTGVSDPYETPLSPEIKINTVNIAPEEVIDSIVKQIKLQGYLR